MEQDKNNKPSEQQISDAQAKTKGGSALAAAGVARSATAQVDAHSNSGLAATGTNISYEGATAPGAGGSVGTGYASGKEATGETLTMDSDYAQGGSANNTGRITGQAKGNEDEGLDDEDLDEDLNDEELDEDLDDEDMDDEDETEGLK